jgi:hypothetical protein
MVAVKADACGKSPDAKGLGRETSQEINVQSSSGFRQLLRASQEPGAVFLKPSGDRRTSDL